MNLHLDETLGINYKSESQKIRVMSEYWLVSNQYCPCCANPNLVKLKNNEPVADIKCDNCGEIFELKSKKGNIGNKINDGAYLSMIERIKSDTNPQLFIMQYSSNYKVTDLTFIPKFFFVPEFIEKRKPLSSNAKRAGWTGCNILYSKIPEQGKIKIINNGNIKSIDETVEEYQHIKKIKTNNLDSQGWLFDILTCINNIQSDKFTLQDMYLYVDELQKKHINNHNIKAKIRQQLQFLRDKGFIEFLERGYYKKII